MKKLDFIYFDAGGGHRSAAMALEQVIAQQGRPWEIRMVNLQEQLDNLDVFRRITGIRLQDYYNLLLKKGWTLGSGELLKGLHVVIRLFQPALVRMLRDFWRAGRPDMVVSLIPNFNRALKLSLEAALPGTPLVTILTDIADYPPHFWIERQQQYLICGSDRAVAQARELGHPDDRIFRASGMILNPRFYEPISGRSRRRAAAPRTRPAIAHRPGAVRRRRLRGDARNRARACNRGTATAIDPDLRPQREAGGRTARDALAHPDVRGRLHPGGALLHASLGLLHRQAGAGQHQRGHRHEAAGDCGAQRLEPAAGALQRASGCGSRTWGWCCAISAAIGRRGRGVAGTGHLRRMRANAATLTNRAVFEIPDLLEGILAKRGRSN